MSSTDASAICAESGMMAVTGRRLYTSQVQEGGFEFMNMPISATYHPRYHTTISILCAKRGKQQKECTTFKQKVEESHISLH